MMAMSNIHFFDVTDHDAPALKQLSAELLPDHQVSFHPGPVTLQPDATIISPFVTSTVSAKLIAGMPQLGLIACRSTGYDNVDLKAAAAHDVRVCNVPSYGENTVAEYGFGLLLALTRKIPPAITQLRSGNTSHDALRGIDLMGKTLGILGAGRIGCHMAQIAGGFGMKVIAFDAYPDSKRAKQYNFTYQTQDEVLAGADILSLHVPNLPETKHLLNAAALAKMKTSAIIINTARGEVIDTRALIDALTTGRIAGAALDVVEGEEIASLDAELDLLRAKTTDRLVLERNLEIATLQKLPNVILTNHNAFNTVEAVGRINRTAVENIAAYLRGQPVNEVKA